MLGGGEQRGYQFGPLGYSLSRSGYSAAVECSVPSLAEVSGKGYQFGLLGHEKGRAVKSSTPFVRKKRLTRVRAPGRTSP